MEDDSGSGTKNHFLMSGCSTPLLKDTWDRPLDDATEIKKNHDYNQRIMEVDQGSFTLSVFTVNGDIAGE